MKISIITINYNNSQGLEQTIISVVRQNHAHYEYIIIDGGSTDGSVEVIKKYDKYITYWRSEPDGGIYDAMNKGLHYSQGDYLLFLNSGDVFYHDHIVSEASSWLKGKDFYVGGMEYMFKKPRTIFPPRKVTAFYLFHKSLSHQATFIKSSLLKERPYDENYRLVSDWEQMFYELVFNNRTYEPLPMVVSRFNTEGLSMNEGNVPIWKNEMEKVLRKTLPERIYADYQIKDKYMLKILKAYHMKRGLAADWKILRNIIKKTVHDFIHLLPIVE